MNVTESQPTPAVPEQPPAAPFTITYNFHADIGFHEAFIVMKALAVSTVDRFDKINQIGKEEGWEERLIRATDEVMEQGGSSLVSATNKVVNDNKVDGKLEKAVAVCANEPQLRLLGQSLRLYAKETAGKVLYLASSGDDVQAYTRGIEGRLALDMFQSIDGIEIPEVVRPKPPFGFAAALNAAY